MREIFEARPAVAGVDRRAFEDVYTQRWGPLVRLAALMTGSVPIAEEIVQDAFVQLHRDWSHVEHPSGWLRVVVINRCRDWARRRAREPRPTTGDGFTTDDGDALAIRDALRVLTDRQRAVVVLRYFEDMSERAIAQTLRCRPGTVKSTLARSLAKLAKELR